MYYKYLETDIKAKRDHGAAQKLAAASRRNRKTSTKQTKETE